MSSHPDFFKTESETYRRLLPELLKEEGRFAVIAGDQLIGTFDTYRDAAEAGYRRRGLDPFMVKQVLRREPVATLASRVIVA